MKSPLTIGAMIIGLGLYIFAGSAMAFDLGDILKQLPQLPAPSQGQQTGDFATAEQPEVSQSKPTQVIIPKDKRVAAAIDEAMPTVKKVLSIHQCLKNSAGMRQMNFYAVTGVDMAKGANEYYPLQGLPIGYTQYHDKNHCLSIKALDHWSMPALNALLFRAVYFAEDSGETVNFLYLFKKTEDGSWKIAQLEKGN